MVTTLMSLGRAGVGRGALALLSVVVARAPRAAGPGKGRGRAGDEGALRDGYTRRTGWPISIQCLSGPQ